MTSNFRNYDIRGEYPNPVGAPMAYAVGYAFAVTMKAKEVAIGCDLRPASSGLHDAVCAGAAAAGARVTNLGECTTEMLTFAVAHEGSDGRVPDCGIMVTASHNPVTQSGFKFIGPDAAPVGPEKLAELFGLIETGPAPATEIEGIIVNRRVVEDYTSYLARVIEGYGDWPVDVGRKPFRIVLDPGMSMAGQAFSVVFAKLKLGDRVHALWMRDFDHDASKDPHPMHPDRVASMQKAIHYLDAQLGLSWDADGDRLVAYDERGQPINGAYLGAYLAAAVGQRFPGEPMTVDQRVVFPMFNTTANMQTSLWISLPGHALMKNTMRQSASCFGAELSGHYYFKEFWWADSGILAAFLTLHMAFLTPVPIGEIMKGMKRAFPLSEEVSFAVPDPFAVINAVDKLVQTRARTDRVDGELVMRSIDKRGDWRACLRPSRTEPLLRLTVESRDDPDIVEDVMAALREAIQTCGKVEA